MLNDIYIGDIINKLPEKIQSIVFSDDIEKIIDNLSLIIGLDEDQKVQLLRNITSLLIGKYDFDDFKNVLLNFNLSQANTVLALDYLNKKLLDNNKNYINESIKIYKKELEKLQTETAVVNKDHSTSITSYIQELASALKNKEQNFPTQEKNQETVDLITSTPKDIVVEKETAPIIVGETNQLSPIIAVNEIKKLEPIINEKKDSILLQAMHQHAIGEESKLNKYYKDLQDSLSEKTKETKNVFQPPFKSSVNRGALIESFFDDTQRAPNITSEASKTPLNSTPIQYKN